MAEEKYVPRLKTKYNNEVKQQLQDKFQYENVMMIPKFEKIVVNMGVGEAATDSKAIDGAVRDLRAITGQQPMITVPASPSLPSACALVCRSAARLPCVATVCGSSSIV